MAHRYKPPAKGKCRELLNPAQDQAATSNSTDNLPNRLRRAQAWLLKRLDATYLVGCVLIIAGAAIFFAAQSTSWLQGAGGVIVGTGFTVLITTVTGRRVIHEQYAKEANLRRKDDLYGPLYAELKNLREILQKACDEGGPYPQRIRARNSAFADEPIAPPGYQVPTLVHWPAFKQGYYWSDFTEPARRVLDRLIDLAEAYDRAVSDVRDPTIAVLSTVIDEAIQHAKESEEYKAWRKKYPTEASWYDAVSKGESQPSWFRRLEFVPPPDMSLGQAWARSWILSWPVQHEPPTVGFLLAGDAPKAAQIIHAGYLTGGDPAPPIQWVEGIFERAIPELRAQLSYQAARAARDRLYAVAREAEQRVLTALNEIQRRYEGGRPPL